MNHALSFSLPEDLLCVSKDAEAGVPIDAITCAIDRADSVLTLLEDHFESDRHHVWPITSSAAVLWDVRGTLGLIKTLTLHGDATSIPRAERRCAMSPSNVTTVGSATFAAVQCHRSDAVPGQCRHPVSRMRSR